MPFSWLHRKVLFRSSYWFDAFRTPFVIPGYTFAVGFPTSSIDRSRYRKLSLLIVVVVAYPGAISKNTRENYQNSRKSLCWFWLIYLHYPSKLLFFIPHFLHGPLGHWWVECESTRQFWHIKSLRTARCRSANDIARNLGLRINLWSALHCGRCSFCAFA